MKEAFRDIAEMMHQADPTACFAFEFWDGDVITYGNKPRSIVQFKTRNCAKEILGKGFTGLGESYMAGELEVIDDFQEILRLGLSINFDKLKVNLLKKLRFVFLSILYRDTISRSPKNISFHYDLGNDFYSLYLDPTMTYSCAYFKNEGESLEQAQVNKYEHIARKLMLSPGESLLDVGCGWGGMIIHAAREYGVNGIGITLSRNQYDYANTRIKELGLEDRIKVLCQDYRELNGQFDKIVSIGMFEHVGQKYIPAFMRRVSKLLKRGGLGLLHTIGKDKSSGSLPWFNKYIFPGGYLPTLSETVHEMGDKGLSVLDVENLRLHYARTLEEWVNNYESNIEKVRAMFDEQFVRRWRLFLHSSIAGFKYGDIRLFQILFSNQLNNSLPATREHIYRP